MSEAAQRYRMTFKCSCSKVFKKLTTDINLQAAPCPSCKKKDKKTKLFKIGDGPIPSTEIEADPYADMPPKVFPNTIYKCKSCACITKIFEDIGETSLTDCPACGSKEIQYRGKISHDVSGQNAIQTKAIDKTAEIVMGNYGMTDLRDNVRVGETMAPKLSPHLQAGADNFFGGARNRNGTMPRNVAAIAKRAMSGALRDTRADPVAMLHASEGRGRTGVVQ